MRYIIFNRKRLYMIFIIVGLMVALLGIEKKFDKNLKYTVLIENDIRELKKYSGLNEKFMYKLPLKWSTEEKDFKSNEIIYHNDFYSPDFKINGFVQVWSLDQDLKEFIKESKKISENQNIIKNYTLSDFNVKDKKGYFTQYSICTNKNIYYKVNEYFLKDKNKFFRFSFFVKEEDFKENMQTIFKTIVNTLEYKE